MADIDEMIRTGEMDITTRECVENATERDARAAEPDAYAMTYEESRVVLQAWNILETVIIQNNFITTDEATGDNSFFITPECTQKVIDALSKHGLDSDEIYALADRVITGNWFTFITIGTFNADNGGKLYLIANVNGKRDEGILLPEKYPIIYADNASFTNFTEKRDALKLPKDAGFLYSSELEFLNVLRQVCNPQLSLEPKIGHLSPYATMPNAAALSTFSRFLNNPHITAKKQNSTQETVEFLKGTGANEYQLVVSTRNTKTTLTVADMVLLFEDELSSSGEKKRAMRGTLSGVKKVWRFALQKLMQQSSDTFIPDEIVIDLDEMVNNGMFSNKDNAYRAIVSMVKKIGLIHLEQDFTEVVVTESGKKTVKKNHGGFMFYDHRRDGSRAYISVNRNFGFEFFQKQYTYFPSSWAYRLDTNAFSLTEYIFSLMRLNAAEIAQKGKFRIKLNTIHNQLGLQSVEEVRENKNRRYNDFIKKPIMQAVDEVNAAVKADKEIAGRFKVTIKATTTGNIDEWLEGYLEISASGQYVNFLNGIADTQALASDTCKERPDRAQRPRSRTRKKKGEN